MPATGQATARIPEELVLALPPLPEIDLLSVTIANVTITQAVEAVVRRVQHGGGPYQISFVNAHCFNVSRADPLYCKSLKASDLVFADGMGLNIAGHILGCPIRDNVNGTDLFPLLCEALAQRQSRIFLLGGKPGVAYGVSQWINHHHPTLVVCGQRHGYDLDENLEAVISEIRSSKAQLLLVGLGVPLQERWLERNLTQTGVSVGIGVGGLFDYFSGRVPRAPMWMRRLGLEWVFRLVLEPRRLYKRYLLGNLTFLFTVCRYRIKSGT